MTGGAVGSQTVWNNCPGSPLGVCQQYGGNGAGGGGFSSVWPGPRGSRAVGGNERRSTTHVPDLSADAAHGDGVDFAHYGGWSTSGGPAWCALASAGFLADVNQGCNATARPRGPALYSAAPPTHADFTDVTTGNNDFTGTNGGDYAATNGYDPATGPGHAAGAESGDRPAGRATAAPPSPA